MNSFNYEGKDSRLEYVTFVLFQLCWFTLYLKFITVNDTIAILPLLLFILPLLSSAVRRINDIGYSKAVIILLIIAPYLMIPFLFFPAPLKKDEQKKY
ncbi:DUF805 domain-containing protein [Winslowiella toletana]|nr:DUF805 domain-containing protein [Winslowiella toletana]